MIPNDDTRAKLSTLIATAHGSAGVCLLMAEELGASNPMLSDVLSLICEDLERAATEAEAALGEDKDPHCDHCIESQ